MQQDQGMNMSSFVMIVYNRGPEAHRQDSSQRRQLFVECDMILGRWDHVPALYSSEASFGVSASPDMSSEQIAAPVPVTGG